MEQKALLDVWAKHGADQHEVCLWHLGSRVQACDGCSLCTKLFPALMRSVLHSEVCLTVCMALRGAARSRGALCSRAKAECPMLAPLAAGFSPSFCECLCLDSCSGVPCALTGFFLFPPQDEVNLELKTRQEARP